MSGKWKIFTLFAGLLLLLLPACDGDDSTSSDGDSDRDFDETDHDAEMDEAGEKEIEYPNDPKDWEGLPCDEEEYTCSLDKSISIYCDVDEGVYVSWDCTHSIVDSPCHEHYELCVPFQHRHCDYVPLPAGSFCRNYEFEYNGVCDENARCRPCGGDTDIEECPEDNLP